MYICNGKRHYVLVTLKATLAVNFVFFILSILNVQSIHEKKLNINVFSRVFGRNTTNIVQISYDFYQKILRLKVEKNFDLPLNM